MYMFWMFQSSDSAPAEIQATRTTDQVGIKENVTDRVSN